MKTLSSSLVDLWNVSAKDFPADASPAERWRFFLRYAILAPSSHNSQPWLFRLDKTRLELYADRTRACRVVDPDDRELIMSCGAALFHLRSALAHFGYLGPVEILPEREDSDLIARLTLGFHGENSLEESIVFHAIPKRRAGRRGSLCSRPRTGDPADPGARRSARVVLAVSATPLAF